LTVYTNFFGGAFFDGGFFGAGTDDATVKTGTGGIDPGEGHRRVPFKPTGIVDRPKISVKRGRKEVEDRVDESRQIQAEIAEKLAREFGEETQAAEEAQAIEDRRQLMLAEMSQAQIDFEIGVLLRKKIKTAEDELILVLLMAAAAA
jgi:hypothetical protein